MGKIRQLFCYHMYSDMNLEVHRKDGIYYFTNRCVKCGKAINFELSERAIMIAGKEKSHG